MLQQVHAVVDAYAEQTKEMEQHRLEQAKQLAVSSLHSHQLVQSLRESQKMMMHLHCFHWNSKV
ncbi:hypothetical protein [Acinetobacter cumulans]|uniref:hypothetical protein n=1 Tax=Acinetobacter cumulans TaxID=2136182 RepID=UPI00207B47B1|nr:hypothetical protein [Acinetobacter cumulans]